MNKASDSKEERIIGTLLDKFRYQARPFVRMGGSVNIEQCLDRAIEEMVRESIWKSRYRKQILDIYYSHKEMVQDCCRKAVLELEKRERTFDIRQTGVGAIVEDFVQTSGLRMQYKLRGNYTVGFTVILPDTGQELQFSAAFSKVMSDGWLEGLKNDLTQFLGISSRLGKIHVTKV